MTNVLVRLNNSMISDCTLLLVLIIMGHMHVCTGVSSTITVTGTEQNNHYLLVDVHTALLM